ncbi:Zeta-carotene desaturase, chloroplastic/chromoplastic [Sesamum angolense]|uniref:Zeta-carotene desaturase, chloroplastic/chromoplastic n=1 Tax=Sesamum angolense TaxID=2727404 RepID=A0AAE2C6H8_9LAMI|nr:Zeta-carotene desaturase, chloroplastic/chromoplastic [Sesamum angolense]
MKVIERRTEDEVVGMAVAATPTAAACLCLPPNGNFRIRSAGFCNRHYSSQFKGPRRLTIRSDLESNVSDMRVNAPKGLFPPEPEHYKGPKLKVAIIGAGLAGMSTAVELLDQGHEVDIYESRSFVGGKVGSYVDKQGNHIEMGLHVFFGCYNNLFRLMKKTVLKLFVYTPFLLCGNNRQCLLTSDLLLVLIHPVVTSVSLVRVDILKVGADKNLIVKDHIHSFVNKGGHIGELNFRFPVGAPLHGIRAFLMTKQLKAAGFCCREPTFATTYDIARNAVALALSPVVRALVDPDGAMGDVRDLDNISFSDWFLSRGGTRTSIQRLWDPVAYALGFIDCDNISARCMLTIFTLFATKTEASLLRMLKGSPDVYLSGPIRKYIMDKGGRFHLRWGCREILYDRSSDGDIYVKGLAMSKATQKKIVQADAYVAACDVPGIKRLLPQNWRESEFFDNIYKLVGVPVVTVQLRYNGWVTELRDLERARQLRQAAGLDNLLYTPDADFSCFADLALTSPEDYYLEGQGSLLQANISSLFVVVVSAQTLLFGDLTDVYLHLGTLTCLYQMKKLLREFQSRPSPQTVNSLASPCLSCSHGLFDALGFHIFHGMENGWMEMEERISLFHKMAKGFEEFYWCNQLTHINERSDTRKQEKLNVQFRELWELRLVDWRVVRGIAAHGGCMWVGGNGYEGAGGFGSVSIFQGLEVTWSSVVKIGQSLYREGPGKDPFRPDQKTPVKNFFLAGSYTKQDYIDSMEGATLSGRQASAYICDAGEDLVALRKALTVTELKQTAGAAMS